MGAMEEAVFFVSLFGVVSCFSTCFCVRLICISYRATLKLYIDVPLLDTVRLFLTLLVCLSPCGSDMIDTASLVEAWVVFAFCLAGQVYGLPFLKYGLHSIRTSKVDLTHHHMDFSEHPT